MAEIVPAYRETEHGRLYRPLGDWAQVLVFLATFVATLGMGWPVGRLLGGLSEAGEIGAHLPFVLIFFLGYATWVARLNALAFTFLGRWLWRLLFDLVVRRRRPKGFEDAMPTRERIEELAVRAQRAGGAFAWVGWCTALPAALLGALMDADAGLVSRAFVLGLSCGLFGQTLAWLARHGCLPMPEGD